MALNINTSGLNDSLRRLASFFMQNKLSEMSNQRYMDTLSEQDRLIRERSAESDVRARGLKQYESKINIDEYIKKAFIDTAKSNDAFDYNVRAAQVARESGDEAKAKALYGKAYELAIPNLTAKMNALKGKANEQDFLATMEAFGEDGVEKLMSESGQSARAATSAGLEKSRQGIDVQKLGLEKAKFGLEKEKFVAEAGPGGGGKTTDYYKAMHSKIVGVQKYLASMKEYVESGGDVSTSVDWEKLLAGPTTPKLLGQALSKLSSYDTKSMKKSLTPEEEAWIDRAWDIMNLQEEEKTGGLGSSIPIPESTAGGAGSAAIPTPSEATEMRPAPQKAAPSAHPVGEKKTVVINGVSATYIWDGTKWLLSDSR